jgi:hypothetical protein
MGKNIVYYITKTPKNDLHIWNPKNEAFISLFYLKTQSL